MGTKPDIIINVPIYYKQVHFFIGKHRLEDFRKICKSIVGDITLDDRKFEYASGLTMGTLVYIEDGDDLATVIHEIYHATSAIKTIAGIDCEESEAYLNSWIVTNFLEKYEKYKKRTNKAVDAKIDTLECKQPRETSGTDGNKQSEVSLVEVSSS